MFRVIAVVFLAWALVGCATKLDSNTSFAPESENGMILIKSTNAFGLNITTFDPETGHTAGPFHGQHVGFRTGLIGAPVKTASGEQTRYSIVSVKPGDFVFRSWERQQAWALCFHADTYSFTVNRGEVVFLGEFDARIHQMELQRNVVRNGDFSALRNQYGQTVTHHHYFDNISPPNITGPTESDLVEANTWLTSSMPNMSSSITPAEFSPATFAVGRNLTGTQRLCGGYYASRKE